MKSTWSKSEAKNLQKMEDAILTYDKGAYNT